ncbi:MAG: hypothetical protein WC971_07525 [Coriobacteriia bacterium]
MSETLDTGHEAEPEEPVQLQLEDTPEDAAEEPAEEPEDAPEELAETSDTEDLDIALAAVEQEIESAEPSVPLGAARSRAVRTWPFVAYAAIWFVFAVAAVFALRPSALQGTIVGSDYYPAVVFVGAALAAVGPVLVLVVWLVARRIDERSRKGLLASVSVRGASATLLGVILWWAALLLLDYFRLGTLR